MMEGKPREVYNRSRQNKNPNRYREGKVGVREPLIIWKGDQVQDQDQDQGLGRET